MKISLSLKIIVFGCILFFICFAVDIITNNPKLFALGFIGLLLCILLGAVTYESQTKEE